MRPHPRIFKTIKWGGVALTVGLAVLWRMSLTTQYSYSGKKDPSVGVASGCIWLNWFHGIYRDQMATGWRTFPSQVTTQWLGNSPFSRDNTRVVIPIWVLMLLASSATYGAWRLETLARRRARAGKCSTCSYPRTGLAPSSPCPECGAAAPQA